MRLETTATLIAVAALGAPLGAAYPAGPKAVIAKAVTQQLRDDFTKHSQAEIIAAISPIDINGDGLRDWQIDWGSFGPAWCGTGGCRYQLWLGRRNAAPLIVFDRQVREFHRVKRAGRIVFVFDFHGSECGGYGSQACPGEFAWNAKRERMVQLRTPGKRSSSSPIEQF